MGSFRALAPGERGAAARAPTLALPFRDDRVPLGRHQLFVGATDALEHLFGRACTVKADDFLEAGPGSADV